MALTRPDKWEGHLEKPTARKIQEYMLIGDRIHKTHRVIVHEITMGDVEDPDLLVAEPIWKWQQTEQGKFVMEKALEPPMWHRGHDPLNWGHKYSITAYLKDTDYTFYQLKWGSVDK